MKVKEIGRRRKKKVRMKKVAV